MNAVDAVVLGAVLVTAFRGYRLGLLREVFGFLGWAFGGLAALRYTFAWVEGVTEATGLPAAVAGLLLFVGIFAVVYLAARTVGWLLARLVGKTFLASVDHTGGLFLGFLEGIALSAAILYLLLVSRLVPAVLPKIEASVLAPPLVEAAGRAIQAAKTIDLPDEVPGVTPESDASPTSPVLPATPVAPEAARSC